MFFDQLARDPVYYFTVVLVVIVSIVLHELGHAFAADRQGDPTPRMLGHFTWDPRVHMGWLSIVLVLAIGVAFGKTPVNPRLFRNKRWGNLIVSFAGPGVNLVLGILCALVLGLMIAFGAVTSTDSVVFDWWFIGAQLNFALFIFNMIPVPPFDGFDVFSAFIDFGELGPWLRRMYPWPMIAAFVLVINTPLFPMCQQLTFWIASAPVALFSGGAG